MNDFNLPPQAIEAEQSLLGSLMLDQSKIIDVINIVGTDDFYRADHQKIIKTIFDLDAERKNIDIITVSEGMSSQDLKQIGGLVYLGQLVKSTPNAANVIAYAKVVRERSALRKIIQSCNSVIDNCYNSDDLNSDDIIGYAENSLMKISEGVSTLESRHIRECMADSVDELEARRNSDKKIVGIPTGYQDLDKTISGLEGGALYIVAARPSMGKTITMMDWAFGCASDGNQTLILSTEMPVNQLINRAWAKFSRVNHDKIRDGSVTEHDLARIMHGSGEIASLPLYIEDTGGININNIRSIARSRKKQTGLGAIFVDYLQILGSVEKSDNRTTEITKISNGLKNIAKEFNVPVVCLSQLNRTLEQRADKRPVMSDLRDSGAIEQDADAIIFLYRDAVYDKGSEFNDVAEFIIAKQRNGECKTIYRKFEGQYQTFSDLDHSRVNAYQQKDVKEFKPKKGLR